MIKLIDLLNESKQVGNLYHFTYLSSVSSIYEKGIHFTPDNTELPKYKDKFYISTTRDHSGRKFAKDSEYVVRITLDGSKISTHYSIEPINQNYLLAKNAGFNDNVNKSVKDVYYEERIWSSKEGYLDPKYIIKIDSIMSEDEIKRQLDWGKEDSRRKLYFDDNIFKYINFVQDYNTK
jgi:hypothetical protein